MKRSSIWLPNVLAFAFVAATFGCSSGGDGGGKGGSSGGGTTGESGTSGSAGISGSAGSGGTTGTAGSGGTTGAGGSGGTPGSAGTTPPIGGRGGAGGTAGSGGGNAGNGGGNGGATAGAGGSGGGGGTPGSAGTTPPLGGRGGNGGTAGGNAGSGGGNAGRGGNGGGNAGRGGSAGGGTAGSGGTLASITLTSTAFTDGVMMIPANQTCAGTNVSPPLAWTAGPSGTMSYAIALVDMTNGFVHWTIWDMPATTMSLPGSLPTTQVLTTPVMAQQINRFSGDGYSGPCPGTMTHTYVFEVYALDVATLPGVSPSMTTEMIRTQMIAHALAKGTLSGMAKTM